MIIDIIEIIVLACIVIWVLLRIDNKRNTGEY